MITRYRAYVLCLGILLLLTAPRPASAQRLPPPALEVSAGWFFGDGNDLAGRFSDSDFVYVRLKYYF